MELGFGPDLNEKGNAKQIRHRTMYQPALHPKLSAPLQCCSVPNVSSTLPVRADPQLRHEEKRHHRMIPCKKK